MTLFVPISIQMQIHPHRLSMSPIKEPLANLLFTWAGVDDLGGSEDLLVHNWGRVHQRSGMVDNRGSMVDNGSSMMDHWGNSVHIRGALGDDSVESVDWVSSVVDSANGTVGLHQRVLACVQKTEQLN